MRLFRLQTGSEREALDAMALQDLDELPDREARLANHVIAGNEIISDDEIGDRVCAHLLQEPLKRRDDVLDRLNHPRMIRRIERAHVDRSGNLCRELFHDQLFGRRSQT